MKKKHDPSLTSTTGRVREMIKELARQQYIQEKMGTDVDFEKLWREAFAEIRAGTQTDSSSPGRR